MPKTFIDKVELQDYKRHEKYAAKVNGNHFILSGMNGSGKTTVLEAIKRLLGQKIDSPDVPVRTGAKKATASVFISTNGNHYVVEENQTSTGRAKLRFYKLNGEKRDELLPAMERMKEAIGAPIDFSPLIDMDGKKQFEFLKENMGVDLSQWEAAYESVYEDRTLVNREVKTLEARINNPAFYLPQADLDTYTEYKDTGALLQQKVDLFPIQKALTDAAERDRAIENVDITIENAERQREDLLRQLEAVNKRIEAGKKWKEENQPIDKAPLLRQLEETKEKNRQIDEELKTVSDHNRLVDRAEQYRQAQADLEQKRQKAVEFSTKLKELEGELYSRLAGLDLQNIVPGLELRYKVDEESGKVTDVGLYYQQLPLRRAQHSYGTLIKVLIKLSAYFNAGKLNFIPIGDWNLLDKKSQQEIWDFAKENPDLGIQFGIEKVDESETIITEIVAV